MYVGLYNTIQYKEFFNNYQLFDEVEQNIVICRWLADQLYLVLYLVLCIVFYRTLSFSHKVFECSSKRVAN